MSSTWLISGASKGIGLGLVTSLLSRPSTTVVATTRNGKPTEALAKIVPATGSRLVVVPLEVTSSTDAIAAIKILRDQHNIDHLDVVWANSGVSDTHMSLTDAVVEDLENTFKINTFGPIRLLQATLPLLRAAKQPKFVVTSTALGSVTLANQLAVAPPAYGASKAGINYFLRRLNKELDELIVVTLHPGLVATDLGNEVVTRTGMEAITVATSVKGILEVVDTATKTSDDQLIVYDHSVLPW